MEIDSLIFNNGLNFRAFESRDMAGIILKSEKVNMEYNIPSR